MASAVDVAPTVVRCKERMDEKAENLEKARIRWIDSIILRKKI